MKAQVSQVNGTSQQNINQLYSNGESFTIPKLKINYDREIIYFNDAAWPLLESWQCVDSGMIPASVLQNHPEIFNRNANGYCKIPVSYEKTIMHFMVVPFPEAGYIGFYGESIQN